MIVVTSSRSGSIHYHFQHFPCIYRWRIGLSLPILLPYRPPSFPCAIAMSIHEKKVQESSSYAEDSEPKFYDPSKESIWTRLGVSLESFKRAPGTTGYASGLCMCKTNLTSDSLLDTVARQCMVTMWRISRKLWPMRLCCSRR